MFAEIIGPDLLIVLGIALLVFGGSRIPTIARSLGQAKAEFEKGLHHEEPEAGSVRTDAPETSTPDV